MSEFSAIFDRIEPDPVSPDSHVARLVADYRHHAATTHLDSLSPDELATFLTAYLRNRALSTRDVENLSDDLGDVDTFSLANGQIITVSLPDCEHGLPPQARCWRCINELSR